MMWIECIGECFFKDNVDFAWLEFELFISLKVFKNLLKLMRLFLFMFIFFVRFFMEFSGIFELVCLLRRRYDFLNFCIEMKFDKIWNKI